MEFQSGSEKVVVNTRDKTALWLGLSNCFSDGKGFALATLNLDHLAKIRNNPEFAKAYRAHEFVVADGNPIVWLSKLAGQPVSLMPGADLVVPLATLAANAGIKVALVGTTEAALSAAANTLCEKVPNLKIGCQIAPPFGFDPTGSSAQDILSKLSSKDVGLCFVALGAPKQEIFAAFGRKVAPKVGFASIGAGLDFLAAQQNRAPKWVRKLALEWLYRLLNNPRRLIGRYAKSMLILPGLAWRALRR